jgi:hypothetical protein
MLSSVRRMLMPLALSLLLSLTLATAAALACPGVGDIETSLTPAPYTFTGRESTRTFTFTYVRGPPELSNIRILTAEIVEGPRWFRKLSEMDRCTGQRIARRASCTLVVKQVENAPGTGKLRVTVDEVEAYAESALTAG